MNGFFLGVLNCLYTPELSPNCKDVNKVDVETNFGEKQEITVDYLIEKYQKLRLFAYNLKAIWVARFYSGRPFSSINTELSRCF